MESVEKECGALGGLFQAIVNDMKVTHANPVGQCACVSVCGCKAADVDVCIFFLLFTAFVSLAGSSPHWNRRCRSNGEMIHVSLCAICIMCSSRLHSTIPQPFGRRGAVHMQAGVEENVFFKKKIK